MNVRVFALPWNQTPVVGQNCRNRPEWLRLTQLRIWSMLEMSTGP